MFETVSRILVILVGVAFFFALAGFLTIRFRERNLLLEEKEKRRIMQWEVQRKDSKKTRYLLLIVAISYLFALGFIALESWQSAQQKYNQQFESSKVPQVRQSTNQEVDISTWQTYRNDEFGFEIRTPRSLPVFVSGEYETQTVISVKNADIFGVFVNKDTTYAQGMDGLRRFWGELVDEGKTISFAGVPAFEFNTGNREGYSKIIVFSHPEKSVVFNIQIAEEFFEQDIPEQILSTFRFFEPIKANFDYPAEWGSLVFKEDMNGTSVFEARENDIIDRVLYHSDSGKVAYIEQGDRITCWESEVYKTRRLYLYSNGNPKLLYETSDPGDSCYFVSVGGTWFLDNSNYIRINFVGYEFYANGIVNVRTGEDILKGYNIILGETFWSENKEVLTIKSTVNDLGGEGQEALFVSEYGNPEKLNRVFDISEGRFEKSISGISFNGNTKVRFLFSDENGEATYYEYDIDTESLKVISSTADWQVYRNEELGFEMKYPDDWRVVNRYDGAIDISPDPEKSPLSNAGNFIEIKSFPLEGNVSSQDIMIQNTFMGESNQNPASFDVFIGRRFGSTYFSYIHNYLSEGQHGGIYYAAYGRQVLSIGFIAYIDMDIFTGEKSFTATKEEQAAVIEEGSVHTTLKHILGTFRFLE
jgi:hypothetical protein